MERERSREKEPEHIRRSQRTEISAVRLQRQKETMASLPHVLKDDDVPWEQSSQSLRKPFIESGPENRFTTAPIGTFTLFKQKLRPNSKGGKHRHYNEAILYIVEGEGYSVLDEVKYPWREGDVVGVPTYCVHQHFNPSPDRWAKVFYSTSSLLCEFMSIQSMEQIELNPAYQFPEGSELMYSSTGRIIGYRTADGTEFNLGLDEQLESLMDTRKSSLFFEEPKNSYDYYLKTLAEQTQWRQTVNPVVSTRDRPWEDTRMGRIKYVSNPFLPSSLLTFDSFFQELLPGGASGKHRHASEEAHLIVEGYGYDIHDGVRWNWKEGDLVCIPVNTVHQHFNADPNKPARFFAIQSRLYHYIGHGGFEHLEDAP